MISINYRDGRPIYEQIKDGFIRLIVSGALPAGSKMPSVRELATSLTINPNTIQRAYRELEAEGYICSAAGKGSFVSGEDLARDKRRAELSEKLSALTAEMKSAGMTEEEIISVIRGSDK